MEYESLYKEFEETILNAELKNVSGLLAGLYSKALDTPSSTALIRLFGKLVKMYGRKNVFLAILDVYDMPEVKGKEYPIGILTYFIRKRLDNESTPVVYLVNDMDTRLEKMRRGRLNLSNPLEENGN